jgi:GrpB-like predicted nucleotidyltransferase (UPF0157 family)
LGERDSSSVRIVDYDPGWSARFESERARVATALGSTARRVEHIGSTAVPGLAAKPVVDVMVTVDDPDDDAAFLHGLVSAGYVPRVIEPEHRMFRSPQSDVHVHLWRVGSDDERRHLLFRDWLRQSADDRALYESVKRGLAERTWEDSNDYALAKGDVVAEIMGRAEGPAN